MKLRTGYTAMLVFVAGVLFVAPVVSAADSCTVSDLRARWAGAMHTLIIEGHSNCPKGAYVFATVMGEEGYILGSNMGRVVYGAFKIWVPVDGGEVAEYHVKACLEYACGQW